MTGHDPHPLQSAESWELAEDLRHIGRMASAWRTAAPPIAVNDSIARPAGDAAATPDTSVAADATTAGAPAELPAWSAAAVTWLGLAALTCGTLLAGWSLSADRPELMPFALPAAAAGLVGLALGRLGGRG